MVPTSEDRIAATQIALSGVADGTDLDELRYRVERLNFPNDTFLGEVILELAADAIEVSGASRERPIAFEKIRERHLPERTAHTKAQHHKNVYTLRAAAMIRAGVDPGLLDEVSWWAHGRSLVLGARRARRLPPGRGRTHEGADQRRV
jgi:hypothetical protein